MDLIREQKIVYLIERRFVELVVEIMKENKLTQKAVSAIAFPDRAEPRSKYRQVVRKSRLGRPQRISFQDAYFLALAVGETPFGLYIRACEDVRVALVNGSLSLNGVVLTKRK